jgi:Carboxypeptidase regulatory-like domain
MLARWLAIFPAAAALLAQTAPEPASISGTVTNSITGEPILRAHVSVTCPSQDSQQGLQAYGALSNAKGEFSVTQLPPGNCSLDVQRVGFVAPVTRAQYLLKNGSRKEGVKLTLIPTGVITGRVGNAAGEPVEGVNVAAELTNGNSANSTTDDKGQFRIGDCARESIV